MALPDQVRDKLEAQFDDKRVKIKSIPGRPDASYLESYDVINKANEVFGYGGWGTQVVNVQMVPVNKKTVCIATIQLDVEGCLPRQDVGVVVSAGDSPEALETAAKGAVSDGIKRNFRHFGKQFGNDLYAKDGDAPKGKPAKKAKASSKGKKPLDAFTAFWSFVKEHDIENKTARAFLKEFDNDPALALPQMKERLDLDDE